MNIPRNVSDKELAAVLNLLRDDHALDTLLVCFLMGSPGILPESSSSTSRQESRSAYFQDSLGGLVVGGIQARDSRQGSFEYSYIGTLLDIMNSTCALGTEHQYSYQASEIYAARARYLRWRQVENNCRRRVSGRDKDDEDENRAWAIFDEASREWLNFFDC